MTDPIPKFELVGGQHTNTNSKNSKLVLVLVLAAHRIIAK